MAARKRKKEVIPSESPSPRTPDGKFLKGTSGNPAGRPKGTKNYIVKLKQDLEACLRENITLDQVQGIVASMVAEAQNGNVSAAKLILDKVLSNARVDEDIDAAQGGLTIKVTNLTVGTTEKPIEGEFTKTEESV